MHTPLAGQELGVDQPERASACSGPVAPGALVKSDIPFLAPTILVEVKGLAVYWDGGNSYQ